jgi:predicted DNA-binding transcriptional regulator YafY
MAQGKQLARQWQILRILENHRFGISLEELSEKAEVTRRTIERDLSSLAEMGFPIQSETRDNGKKFWKLKKQFLETDSLIFSPTEIVSFYLANKLINPLAGTCLGDSWEGFLKKLQSLFPKAALNYFSELDEIFYVKSSQTSKPVSSTFIETIRKAIKDSKVIEFDYLRDNSEGNLSIVLHPYGLIVHENAFYVIGFSEGVEGIRTYKLQRMQSITLTRKAFKRPDDFSIEKMFKGSFGMFYGQQKKPITVRCELRGWAARMVREQKWHRTQVIEKDDENAVIVSFLLSSTIEFIRWVLGFGPMAYVIEPEDVKNEVLKHLQSSISNYKN